MISWRVALALGVAVSAALIAIAAVLFQDNITRFQLNPRIPYQTYAPPPPPAYGARGAWALWPENAAAGEADVFYVHSTTYGSNRNWNAPLTDRQADETLRRIAAPNEAGPFLRIGPVYGPRYRQATLFAAFTHKFDGLAARELAFKDVENAFLHFLKERPQNRPFILVGYGQGGLHVLGLLQFHIDIDPRLRRNLAAAYIIRQPLPMRLFDKELSTIAPCATPQQTQCVIAYIDIEPNLEDEKRRYRQRSLIWDDNGFPVSQPRSPLLCVNPLSWTMTQEPVSRDHHLGAASATGLRMNETPPPIEKAIGAQCVDGVLIVEKPRQNFLRRRHWFGDHWRAQHFNLFYHDLTADAARRIAALKEQQAEETVDLEAHPDDKGAEDFKPNERERQ